MQQIAFVQLARKYAVPFYVAAGVMLVVDFVVMYKNYLAYNELRFNWLVFNVYVVSIMGATLALAGKMADKPFAHRLIRLSSASFFLYAAHILWLEPLRDYLLKVLAPSSNAAVILFFFAFIAFHCTIVTALYFLMRRILPKTTAVLTGGRVFCIVIVSLYICIDYAIKTLSPYDQDHLVAALENSTARTRRRICWGGVVVFVHAAIHHLSGR